MNLDRMRLGSQIRRLAASAVALVFALALAHVVRSTSVGSTSPVPMRASPSCDGVYAGASPVLIDRRLESGARPLCFRAFALLHSAISRTPVYAAEHLTRSSVVRAERQRFRDGRFHPEPRLPPDARAELADYRGSGLDRGHLVPSGDMTGPVEDYQSFSLANIVPQDPRLNRGGWADLERYVRSLTLRFGQTYVVTGPAFLRAKVRRLHGRLLVPSHVWKAVYVPGHGAGAWIAANDRSGSWRVLSIRSLAARTGVAPFPTLPVGYRRQIPAFPVFPTDRSKGASR